LPPGIAKRSIGPLRLRGKENETEIYALTTAEVVTRPSGEVRSFRLDHSETRFAVK